MTRAWRCLRTLHAQAGAARRFTTTAPRWEVRDVTELPARTHPHLKETSSHELLALHWPSPPRNVLLVRKEEDAAVDAAVLEFARHLHSAYPDVSLIFEPSVAQEVHASLAFPIYTPHAAAGNNAAYQEKVDVTATLGGDGTILHAASLFATATRVPPILSFSMGTLGFLGEWNFHEYKRAFRDVYVSGAPPSLTSAATIPAEESHPHAARAWANVKGRSMGATRTSRILMRNRLRIGLFDNTGQRLLHEPPFAHDAAQQSEDIFALNEVLLHRGALPHLAHLTILIGAPGSPHQRTLTTAIADGFLVSTPTGSTAYSLSSGGAIVHPLVASLLLTPICPRSLSFRPLVLPANTPVTLRIDAENRGKEIEVSVDGVRRQQGLKAGMEVRVVSEQVRAPGKQGWIGGVPSIVRSGGAADGQDHWVGGLNSLLKFNYPFGEDA